MKWILFFILGSISELESRFWKPVYTMPDLDTLKSKLDYYQAKTDINDEKTKTIWKEVILFCKFFSEVYIWP